MIFVGHSHMICVINAALDAGLHVQGISLKPINDGAHLFGADRAVLLSDTGKPDFSEQTRAILRTSPGPILSFVSAISHVHMGLRRATHPHEPPFDFVLPEHPDRPLQEDAVILPFAAVRDAVASEMRTRFKLIHRLAVAAGRPFYQFAPPPPVPDAWVVKLPGYEAAGPTTNIRWKLWRTTVGLFREQAERNGARFVDCPPEAVDADGVMHDALVRNITHGNVAFGAMVLAQIRALVAGRSRPVGG